MEDLLRQGIKVHPLNWMCPHRQQPLYQVRDTFMTPQQMIVLMNELRYERGERYPLTVKGYTH